ncbi:MAG: hypothetical protein ACXWHF_09840 [Chthoniobacterales bacterium]
MTNMRALHSASKEQREAVRQLLHTVLIRDMGTFNVENFKSWIQGLDAQFRRCSLMLRFDIRTGVVHFTVKEIRTGRPVYEFPSSTRVRFDDDAVVLSGEDALRFR